MTFAGLVFLLTLLLVEAASNDVYIEPVMINLVVEECSDLTFAISTNLTNNVRLSIKDSEFFDTTGYVDIPRSTGKGKLRVVGKRLESGAYLEIENCSLLDGNTTIGPCPFSYSTAYATVDVIRSHLIDTFEITVGWVCFFAWSISFYPQIYLNFKRKSVAGLSFDFLSLNTLGYAAYSVFNVFMYFDTLVQNEYRSAHPRSPIPVLLNDVVFAVHALFACLLTAVQCVFYERQNQRISGKCSAILSILVLAGLLSGALETARVISLLDFVTSLSYIKMAVTLSKYFPQAYFNYQRKSTVGWSIENVLLDFTGGVLTIIQMVLQGYNSDDWSAFYGNVVKFGLGLVSIVFDIVFIVQHYVLYCDISEKGEAVNM